MKLLETIKYVAENSNSVLLFTPPIYPGGKTYFFERFDREIILTARESYNSTLQEIEEEIRGDKIALGLINYEFGYMLEPRLEKLLIDNNKELLRFLFIKKNELQEITSDEICYGGLENIIGDELINNFRLNTKKEEYIRSVEKIKEYIAEGDTYQVNYTIKSRFELTGEIEKLFAQLLFTQSAKYIALINLNEKIIISASPELFFKIEGNKITVKPMKGTIGRGTNRAADEINKNELLLSTKDQAENIMIVDLLRNDIGKICEYDSVQVNKKYEVENYESIFQLTSTITGRLRTKSIPEIIKNIFPCGSITGAPKLRTMEIINELENENRGIYTGSIGIFGNDFTAANVAIRTLEINKAQNTAELGIGSGIVWDSDPEKEYEEVMLKSNFLRNPVQYFELFETMLVENGEIFLLDQHLRRLNVSSEYFLFNYDEEKVKSTLMNHLSDLSTTAKYKVKLNLNKWGNVEILVSQIDKLSEYISVVISPNKINTADRFQYFKTTNRKLYDEELKKYRSDGFDEVIYLNENNEIAEGSFTNLLVQISGEYYTPPIEAGILNGCYRSYLIDNFNKVTEKTITIEEIIKSEKLILINSVRKEIVVSKMYDENKILIKEFSVNE